MNPSRMGVRTAAALTFAALTMAATSASAHVTVSSPDAAPGGFGKIIFRVPTESDTASTNKVEIKLPTGTPFASVSTKNKPGWKATISMKKFDSPIKIGNLEVSQAADSVTWTTTSEGIGPTQFDEFELSVGPFPKDAAKPLTFTAIQSYDDGEIVTWDDVAKGEVEPEKPAPVLSLDGSIDHHGATAQKSADAKPATGGSSDNVARGMGGVALLLAAVSLLAIVRKNGQSA